MSSWSMPSGRAGADGTVRSIVSSVAEKKGVKPEDLAPLYDAIDPDQLTTFVEVADPSASTSFQYCGWYVSVYGDGNIELQQPPDHE